MRAWWRGDLWGSLSPSPFIENGADPGNFREDWPSSLFLPDHHVAMPYVDKAPTGREGSFCAKLVEPTPPLMSLHGRLSTAQRGLRPGCRRSGAVMKTRGVEATSPATYG